MVACYKEDLQQYLEDHTEEIFDLYAQGVKSLHLENELQNEDLPIRVLGPAFKPCQGKNKRIAFFEPKTDSILLMQGHEALKLTHVIFEDIILKVFLGPNLKALISVQEFVNSDKVTTQIASKAFDSYTDMLEVLQKQYLALDFDLGKEQLDTFVKELNVLSLNGQTLFAV